MAETEGNPASPASWATPRRPSFWLVALTIIAALFAIYWFFLRATYLPVLVNLEAQDAADVAKVLDAKKIGYRFEDDGRTIAVLSDQIDKARVELAGSELPMKGQIGFELFNQSDMGLTEFAQKINFQRALQGEISRTILLLDGIQTVRVHLALPERSLFRGEQEQAKASVTLILKPGKALSSATVLGIQRLVAGAVPDLSVEAVTVLDGTGRMVSPDVQPSASPEVSSDALVESIRQRIIAAIARIHPDLRFGLVASVHYLQGTAGKAARRASEGEVGQAEPAADYAPRGVPDYVYALRLTTEQPVAEGLRSDLERMISQELDLAPARGDSLVFLVGPILPQPAVRQPEPRDTIVARADVSKIPATPFAWHDWWLGLPAVAALLVGLAVWSDRRRVRTTRESDLANFAEVLRQRLDTDPAG